MSEIEKGLLQTEVSKEIENQCGIILGYWDHEKTPALIQDLEHSVSLVERKCKKLLSELTDYKKYLEKSGDADFHLNLFQKISKKSKNSHFFSGSDPDIAFRKNLINFQKMELIFEEKFQERLLNINTELTEAAHKIGLKNNLILIPVDDRHQATKAPTEDEESIAGCDVLENFEEGKFFNAKTKSDSLILENKGMPEFSRITKNELELYQKLSRLSIKRRRKKKKLKGRKDTIIKGRNIKVLCKKNTSRCRQGLSACNIESENPKSSRKKFKKGGKKISITEKDRNDSHCEIYSNKKLSGSEIKKMCKSLAEAVSKNSRKSGGEFADLEQTDDENSILGTAIKKVIPFTACTSTSRSYNIGLNIQQLFSMSKHRGKSGLKTSASEKIDENIGAVVFQASAPNFEKRKVRSKYTGNSAAGFLRYHKSTVSQYTNGRKSMIKSESKTAYALGSKIMVSDWQRTDYFDCGKDNNGFKNASGDGTFNKRHVKLNTEPTKVYNSFLNIYRKYTTLKEKISGNNSTLADEELKSLEKEIDDSVEKYKDFLRFYSKFLWLNQRLKSLKIACETEMFEPVTSFYSDCHWKMCRFRPTYSMTMKRALREVQALQDKIRLVSD